MQQRGELDGEEVRTLRGVCGDLGCDAQCRFADTFDCTESIRDIDFKCERNELTVVRVVR